jgi:EF hand domain-containing protein
MGPAATTACGILVGLIVFLAMAVLGVVAVNGTDNPGFARQASAAAGGTAPKAPPTAKGGFDSLDLDKDGKLTLAEAAGYADIVTRFDRADRNRDGKLTQAEFDRLAKLPPAKAPKAKAKASKKPPSRTEATAAAGG